MIQRISIKSKQVKRFECWPLRSTSFFAIYIHRHHFALHVDANIDFNSIFQCRSISITSFICVLFSPLHQDEPRERERKSVVNISLNLCCMYRVFLCSATKMLDHFICHNKLAHCECICKIVRQMHSNWATNGKVFSCCAWFFVERLKKTNWKGPSSWYDRFGQM